MPGKGGNKKTLNLQEFYTQTPGEAPQLPKHPGTSFTSCYEMILSCLA